MVAKHKDENKNQTGLNGKWNKAQGKAVKLNKILLSKELIIFNVWIWVEAETSHPKTVNIFDKFDILGEYKDLYYFYFVFWE